VTEAPNSFSGGILRSESQLSLSLFSLGSTDKFYDTSTLIMAVFFTTFSIPYAQVILERFVAWASAGFVM